MPSTDLCAVLTTTTDNTSLAITTLPGLPKWVYYYTFRGFGAARTVVFREAWRKFGGNFTHVLVADPDWEPQGTLSLAELDLHHMAFQFKISTEIFTRLVCLVAASLAIRLAFKYRLHEQLLVPPFPGIGKSAASSLRGKLGKWR